MTLNITKAIDYLRADLDSVDTFTDELYAKYFNVYFESAERLYQRFKSVDIPITDSELESIITSLPLDMYAASTALSQFQAHHEIAKLSSKQAKRAETDTTNVDLNVPTSEEYQVMIIIYNAVISRVERQISFSKELIMGAKKVWDARRKTEQVPIKEITTDLPDYVPTK